MFTAGLSSQTQANMEKLSSTSLAQSYYLAGGTALSLHYGHRYSHDLDFFSEHPETSFKIASTLKDLGELEIFQNDEGTFNGRLNEVKLSFFIYPYSPLSPTEDFMGIQIAQIDDIACMKLDAISSRGTKRDFVDLYTICKRTYTLPKIFEMFDRKYAPVKYNRLHIIKSLVYFDDAEQDSMPQMLESTEWVEVKNFFQQEIKKIVI
jgi:predicted nucleotidyltransferase component of viral defense system